MGRIKVSVSVSTLDALEEVLKEIPRLEKEYPDARFDVRVSK